MTAAHWSNSTSRKPARHGFDHSTIRRPDIARFIAEITGVELIAAVTRRQRQGNTSSADAAALAEIELEFANGHVLLEVSRARVLESMVVARRQGLRSYDAVQLAMALYVRDQYRATGLPDPILVTADAELLNAALVEGLPVDNPNAHP